MARALLHLRRPAPAASMRPLGSGTQRPLPRCASAPSRSWRAAPPGQRSCGSSAATAAASQPGQRWDITPQRWVDFKLQAEDHARFPGERIAFRGEPRLRADALPPPPPAAGEGMPRATALRGAVSCLRLGDWYTPMFEELVHERLAEQPALMELFHIPALEDKPVVQPLHSKAVPGEGTYHRVRMQAYWLALHVWLLHSKQHAVQEGEGLFVSALCALLTRRIFEFQWNRIRMILHAADVPIMSVSNELQDLQEFIFGFCVGLDDAFREEAPAGTARALALEDAELPAGCLGLAPRVKYALWANVYSGAEPHDAKHLHELTVYLLRQRMALEVLPRDCFLSCRFHWADHPY